MQRYFVRRISGIHHLNYWQQLRALSLYSLERRRERYMTIYLWRILEGQVPNLAAPDTGGITANWHIRRGRNCHVNTQAPAFIQKLRYSRFPVHGPRLFNTLPASIRNKTGCTVKELKRGLDKFLGTVPDEPQIPGYTKMRRAESNSLIHMAQFTTAQHEILLEELHDMSAAGGGHPCMVTLGIDPETTTSIHK